MKRLDAIRQQLRALQAIRYSACIRRELMRTPDDPDLRWALRQLAPLLQQGHVTRALLARTPPAP